MRFFALVTLCFLCLGRFGFAQLGVSNHIADIELSPINSDGQGSLTITVFGSSPDCFAQNMTHAFSGGVFDVQLYWPDRRACFLDLRREPLTNEFQIDEPPVLIQASIIVTENGGIDDEVRGGEGPDSLLEFTPIPGDANYDGIFDSTDFVSIFRAGQYEDDVPRNSIWFSGDWNNDREFTTSDLVVAFQARTFAAAADMHVVPEPSALALLAIGILVGFATRFGAAKPN